jgi:hypothetical protein
LWICTRAPSSLSSSCARPSCASASSTSTALCASIGCTGSSTESLKRVSPAAPVREHGARDGRSVAREHRGAAYLRGVDARCARDRVDHHAFERALAQLADEQPREKVLLGVRRGGEERDEQLAPRGDGASALHHGEAIQRRVDGEELERGLRGGRYGTQFLEDAIAHADAALAQASRQIVHPNPDLFRRQAREQRSELLDLGGAAAGRGDRLRGADQLVE